MLRWTTPDGDARRRIAPAARLQPFAPFLGAAVAGRHQGRAASSSAFTEAHLRGVRAGRLAGCRRPSPVEVGALLARRRAVRLRLLRRHRQDRPRARLRRRTTTPSCAPPTGSSATSLDALPPGAALLVTADHGQVDVGDRIVQPGRRRAAPGRAASRARAGSAGCTPGPARADDLLAAAADALRRRRLGASAASRCIDERLVRPDGRRAGRRPPRRRGPRRPRRRSASTTRPTAGRSSWSAATAR